jgi:uncharacterized RmlC-like cupin family protein
VFPRSPGSSAPRIPREPSLWSSAPLYASRLPDCAELNRRILAAYAALDEGAFTQRSHHIGGRFENLYLDRTRIPEVDEVLAHAERCAREVLGMGSLPLRSGFWLNVQGPGHATSAHTHDENDELLSGVYYVSVPAQSGNLILLDSYREIRVAPAPGMFLSFPPALPHRVETNRSQQERFSIVSTSGRHPHEPVPLYFDSSTTMRSTFASRIWRPSMVVKKRRLSLTSDRRAR